MTLKAVKAKPGAISLNANEVKLDLEEITGALLNEDTSEKAGMIITSNARATGVSVKDYLTAAIKSPHPEVSGYDLIKSELNLASHTDIQRGMSLAATSDIFSTFVGTRSLFSEVLDDMIRYSDRQDMLENVDDMIMGTANIVGNQMISTIIDDVAAERKTFTITEGSNIPVRSFKASAQNVVFFKHGSGFQVTYEVDRRLNLDLFTPHASRVLRDLQISKAQFATSLLLNGDAVNAAAPVVAQSSFDATTGITTVAGKLAWENLLAWLNQRSLDRYPVDTLIMNGNTMMKFNIMMGKPQTAAGPTGADLAASVQGLSLGTKNISLLTTLNIVYSSTVPDDKIIGITKGETMRGLKEIGSDITETERLISTQHIVWYKTENVGYELVYAKARSVYNINA